MISKGIDSCLFMGLPPIALTTMIKMAIVGKPINRRPTISILPKTHHILDPRTRIGGGYPHDVLILV